MAEVGLGAERTTREIEGIIGRARELKDDALNIKSRLYDMRARLLGINDPPATEDSNLKEAVGSEMHDLRTNLDELDAIMKDSKTYLADLEGV